MLNQPLLGQVADVDIRLLRVFRAVAESGGLAAAESELNIGRSTISRHLNDLEARLGVTLCSRGRGGFALTDEGDVIYRAALRLLANIENFRSEVNEVRQQIAGHMTLAFFDKTATNPAAQIGAAIRALDARAPDITLEIFTEPLNAIEQGVQEGRFQIGLGPMHKPMPGLAYYPLFDEPMSLYCGSANPLYGKRNARIDARALKSVRYAGLAYRSPNMDVSRNLGLQRSATVYDQESIATLILSGRYIGFLPDHYADGFVSQSKMRRIAASTHHYKVQFAAVVRHTPRLSRMTSLFLECLQEAHGRNHTGAVSPIVAAARHGGPD